MRGMKRQRPSASKRFVPSSNETNREFKEFRTYASASLEPRVCDSLAGISTQGCDLQTLTPSVE
jgi:hypothetical protein